MKVQEVRLSDITIRRRVRKDLGDLVPLADSIRRHGLLNPIVLSESLELIAGHRRLESVRSLGWRHIPAIVMRQDEAKARLVLEIEENVQRADLNPEELAEAYFRLERMKNPGFFVRLWIRILTFFKRIVGAEASNRKVYRSRKVRPKRRFPKLR